MLKSVREARRRHRGGVLLKIGSHLLNSLGREALIDALTAWVPRALSPMPVRALGGDAERDARRLVEQLANPAAEHLVGVGRPLAGDLKSNG